MLPAQQLIGRTQSNLAAHTSYDLGRVTQNRRFGGNCGAEGSVH